MSATKIEIRRSLNGALGRLAADRSTSKAAIRRAVFDSVRALVVEAGVSEVPAPRFSVVPDSAPLSGPSMLFAAFAAARVCRAAASAQASALAPQPSEGSPMG